jgi:bifunctional enzyme CysN/CysC
MIANEITDIEEYLRLHENKGLLRFITCGSVDDGKSTLIGRLLHDTKMIYEDQLASLARDSKASGSRAGEIDLSYLVDGLQSEREQGITIDVAYRYFSTDRRKFIIADTPGHEQYTRNMATGASTADLAIILIDARHGVQTQTRRHSFICDLLGIKHFVIAVNKMDLVDYDQAVFNRIREDYLTFAKVLNVTDVRFVPMSALEGENVTSRSGRTPWYTGDHLLELLESVELSRDAGLTELRFPVQYVNRPNLNFRGYCGTLSAGELALGQRVKVLPSGKTSAVKSIVTWEGEQPTAFTGQAVTVALADEIDISRGDLLTAENSELRPCQAFEADVVWMHENPLQLGAGYDLKIGHAVAHARVSRIVHQVDVNTLAQNATDGVPLNGIARCQFEVTRPVVLDPYRRNRATGSFVVIDKMSNLTVGAGMVTKGLDQDAIVFHEMDVTKETRAKQNGQKPVILWFTGLSGSGKSTVANALEQRLFGLGRHTYLLDGDNVRHGLCRDLGFSQEDRTENIRRIGEVAKLMVDAGLIVLVSAISPLQADRATVRAIVEDGEFIEIYVNTPLDTCESRDPKGLYKRARAGEIREFTGISSPYEAPENPEIVLDGAQPVEASLAQILEVLGKKGIVR